MNNAKLEALSATSEQLGAAKEAIRILNELTSAGSTGDNFEIRWDDLLRIIRNER
jgi:hypothetical protein